MAARRAPHEALQQDDAPWWLLRVQRLGAATTQQEYHQRAEADAAVRAQLDAAATGARVELEAWQGHTLVSLTRRSFNKGQWSLPEVHTGDAAQQAREGYR